MDCNTNDFMFPMKADIFYPVVEQGAYGNVSKTWILDRTLICNFSNGGTALKEEIRPEPNILQDTVLIGRTKEDIRLSDRGQRSSITNVVVSNIKDSNCNEIYVETTGPRAGRSTIFEVATLEPYPGPFGGIEYYKVVLRRSENQAADL